MTNIFVTPQTLLALNALNEHIAAIFNTQIKKATFEFVPFIDERRQLIEGKQVMVRQTLGDCFLSTGAIRLVAHPQWRRTAIHELVHLYNPGRSEKTIRKLTLDVVNHLKWTNHERQAKQQVLPLRGL